MFFFQFLSRLEGPLKPSDPELIDYIKEYILVPPSTLSYNLKENDKIYNNYKTIYPSWKFIESVTHQLFVNTRNGFFIEAGAYDGEYLSSSLSLELQKNWTGLLVEADKDSIAKMKYKNRKAWLSPTCLGIQPFPYQTILSKFDPIKNEDKKSSKIKVRIRFI